MRQHKATHSDCFNTLEQHYASKLARQESERFFAPGRVNLIGEYTDFNGGLVLPCAIDLGTYLILVPTKKQEFAFFSMQEPEEVRISKQQLMQTSHKQAAWAWANYPIAVLKHFETVLLEHPGGFDFFFYGNLPVASGLSSSASIEVLTAFALKSTLDTKHSLRDIALLTQAAENHFIDVQCGIMDQYAIAHGLEQHALLIDCQQVSHTDIAMPMLENGYQWLIINSNKTRQLRESKYNERRQECDEALALLQNKYSLEQLCDFPFAHINKLEQELNKELLFRRARHVISEQQRVLDFATALANAEVEKLGELMNASHQSLKKDFEVSGDILDELVKISQNTEGVVGARMTGAGFGGCTINLVEADKSETIIQHIGESYQERCGLNADFYLAKASRGVHQIQDRYENQ